ncbi:MAG: histone-like nucleoid-structuring protein Lsr2 [Streptosporangiaceae bacterium]
MRAWAKAHGLQVTERGKIPATIVEEYEAAH